MRTLIFSVILSLIPVSAFAVEFDGCYSLYQPGSLGPVICLEGTTEEGIGGAGARIYVFVPGTSNLSQCLTSSGLSMRGSEIVVQVRGKNALVMNLKGSSQNTAIISGKNFSVSRVGASDTTRLLNEGYKACDARN